MNQVYFLFTVIYFNDSKELNDSKVPGKFKATIVRDHIKVDKLKSSPVFNWIKELNIINIEQIK